MNILQVCPYDLARAGGVQRHVLDLSGALIGAGHAVTIAAPTPLGAPIAPPAHTPHRAPSIISLGGFRTAGLHGTRFEISLAPHAQLRSLLALHRDTSFDVVHFHTPWTPFMPWQVFRLMCPVVPRRIATFHDTPPPTVSGRVTRALFRILSRRLSMQLDAMIAVSTAPALHLRPRPQCPLFSMPPCIDLAKYRELPGPSRSDKPLRVLFVGRLEPRKGVTLLLRAFAQLRRRTNADLVICGDGAQMQTARDLAASLGLANGVTFTGAVGDTTKRQLFTEADIFCAPSPYGESYGLVIAEAMSAGLPVVAAANAGYSTVLTGDGAAGLVTPGDSRALSARLMEFADSPALRERLSSWGRTEAWRSDVNARLAEFVEIYSDPLAA